MPDARSRVIDREPPELLDPVEAYKPHIDLTLIREQLRRTTDERAERMIAALRLAEALRAAGRSRA